MNDDKKFLFPASGSHLLGVILSLGLIGVIVYDLAFGARAFMREGNVFVDALMLFLLLAYISILEACMIILYKGYLFAYNVDKAICLPICGGDLRQALSKARKIFGPVFSKNCESQFSANPASTQMRKAFYTVAVGNFFLALISPTCHLVTAAHNGAWSRNLFFALVLVAVDAAILVNRIFFRASIRKFWAVTLGDGHYRDVLKFEMSTEKQSVELVI